MALLLRQILLDRQCPRTQTALQRDSRGLVCTRVRCLRQEENTAAARLEQILTAPNVNSTVALYSLCHSSCWSAQQSRTAPCLLHNIAQTSMSVHAFQLLHAMPVAVTCAGDPYTVNHTPASYERNHSQLGVALRSRLGSCTCTDSDTEISQLCVSPCMPCT